MEMLSLKIKGRNKKECQDSVYIRKLKCKESEVVVFALSDGASSSPKSRIGSEYATRTFVKQVIKNIRKHKIVNNKDIEDLVRISYEDLISEFRERFYPNFKDYYATFVGGILIISEDSPKVGFISVGDSVLFLLKRTSDGSYKVVGKNQILKGESIERTFFFNGFWGYYAYDIQVHEDFDAILLFSDGFEDLLYKERKIDTNLNRKFHEIHRWESEILETLHTLMRYFDDLDIDNFKKSLKDTYQSDSFMDRNDDDKSLIIIGRISNGESKRDLEQ